MTRALTVSLLTVAATLTAALLVSPAAEAGPGQLHLAHVESQIEAQVDARLHTILQGFIQHGE